jgi:hypothetical protein
LTSIKQWVVAVLTVVGMSLPACGPYSFTGASIPPEVKTVQVDFFENRADIVVPELSQQFTEKLKDKFVTETRLTLVRQKGDLQFSGQIVQYRVSTQTVSGTTERASESRLTIAVKLRYANEANPKDNFEKTFSQYAVFDATQSLSSVEDQLIDQITDRLIQDIFNATVNNW